jgi:hypothetical protein
MASPRLFRQRHMRDLLVLEGAADVGGAEVQGEGRVSSPITQQASMWGKHEEEARDGRWS